MALPSVSDVKAGLVLGKALRIGLTQKVVVDSGAQDMGVDDMGQRVSVAFNAADKAAKLAECDAQLAAYKAAVAAL